MVVDKYHELMYAVYIDIDRRLKKRYREESVRTNVWLKYDVRRFVPVRDCTFGTIEIDCTRNVQV